MVQRKNRKAKTRSSKKRRRRKKSNWVGALFLQVLGIVALVGAISAAQNARQSEPAVAPQSSTVEWIDQYFESPQQSRPVSEMENWIVRNSVNEHSQARAESWRNRGDSEQLDLFAEPTLSTDRSPGFVNQWR